MLERLAKLDADGLTFNRQTNLFEARRPRIVQGTIRIEADESVGSGVDFERASEWRFKGHVKITVDKAVLEAVHKAAKEGAEERILAVDASGGMSVMARKLTAPGSLVTSRWWSGTIPGLDPASRISLAVGDITGDSETEGGVQHAYLWRGGVMTDLDALSGLRHQGNGIAEAGRQGRGRLGAAALRP